MSSEVVDWRNSWACLEVGSIGYGSGFGLQIKISVRLSFGPTLEILVARW
jgi:hypothetical protein